VKSRANVYKEGIKNIRFVSVVLVNSSGELWIPRRAAHKKMYPLHLDMSAAGHVLSGEGYDEAFKREVREKLHIAIEDARWRFLGHMSPREHDVSAHMHAYELTSDTIPAYNKNDFCEYAWMTPREILEAAEFGEKIKSDVSKLVKRFYT